MPSRGFCAPLVGLALTASLSLRAQTCPAGGHADFTFDSSLARMRDERAAAERSHDLDAFRRTTTERFIQIDTRGSVHTLAERLDVLRTAAVRATSAPHDQVCLFSYDNVVVETQRVLLPATGQYVRYGNVLVRENGEWKVAMTQMTPITTAQVDPDPLIGTWTTDTAKSTAAPGPMRFKSWTSRIERAPDGR